MDVQAPRALQDHRELPANLGIPDLRALPVPLEFFDLLPLLQLVAPVHLDAPAPLVSLVKVDVLATMDVPDLQDLKEIPADLGNLEDLGTLVPLVSLEAPELLAAVTIVHQLVWLLDIRFRKLQNKFGSICTEA